MKITPAIGALFLLFTFSLYVQAYEVEQGSVSFSTIPNLYNNSIDRTRKIPGQIDRKSEATTLGGEVALDFYLIKNFSIGVGAIYHSYESGSGSTKVTQTDELYSLRSTINLSLTDQLSVLL
ncbi:MAG: hypothetical protein R3240_05465, partial [Gammaproteobacteria bacterium]|nr:hypothetical protein [Gammaproteobacteria bacterium]